MKNNLNKGLIRCIAFKEDKIWYGVALELNIVEEGNSYISVRNSLSKAIKGYIETAQKLNVCKPLNQKVDREYEEMWKLCEN
jgi:hypothetical protein